LQKNRLLFSHRFTQINADRFKYKEITDRVCLEVFIKLYNELGEGLYLIIKDKISVMISVDRWLSSYKNAQMD